MGINLFFVIIVFIIIRKFRFILFIVLNVYSLLWFVNDFIYNMVILFFVVKILFIILEKIKDIWKFLCFLCIVVCLI